MRYKEAGDTMRSNSPPSPSFAMRRLVALSTALSLLMPLGAGAFFQKTSELIAAIQYDGLPRSYAFEMHAQVEEVYISAWIRGATEGMNPATMKSWNTITMHMDGTDDGQRVQARMKLALHINQGMGYVRVESVEGSVSDEVLKIGSMAELNKWIAFPLTDLVENGLMMENGKVVLDTEQQALVHQLFDGVLAHTYTRYSNGYAFSVKLHPNWLNNASMVLFGTDAADTALLQEDFSKNVNLHFKIDTDFSGNFRFGKFYVSAAHEEFSFVMQGTAERTGVVRVETPTNTMTVEEFSAYLEKSDLVDFFRKQALPVGLPIPGMDMWDMREQEWDESEWEEMEWDEEEEISEEWNEEDAWEQRALLRQQRLEERRHRTPERPAIERSPTPLRQSRSDVRCTAEPGTPQYLQEMRKGACGLSDPTDHRVSSNRTVKLKPYPASWAPPTGDGFKLPAIERGEDASEE